MRCDTLTPKDIRLSNNLFFGPRYFPYSNYLCRAPDIVALGTIFNVLSYVSVGPRYEPFTYPAMRYVLSYGRGSFDYKGLAAICHSLLSTDPILLISYYLY